MTISSLFKDHCSLPPQAREYYGVPPQYYQQAEVFIIYYYDPSCCPSVGNLIPTQLWYVLCLKMMTFDLSLVCIVLISQRWMSNKIYLLHRKHMKLYLCSTDNNSQRHVPHEMKKEYLSSMQRRWIFLNENVPNIENTWNCTFAWLIIIIRDMFHKWKKIFILDNESYGCLLTYQKGNVDELKFLCVVLSHDECWKVKRMFPQRHMKLYWCWTDNNSQRHVP